MVAASRPQFQGKVVLTNVMILGGLSALAFFSRMMGYLPNPASPWMTVLTSHVFLWLRRTHVLVADSAVANDSTELWIG